MKIINLKLFKTRPNKSLKIKKKSLSIQCLIIFAKAFHLVKLAFTSSVLKPCNCTEKQKIRIGTWDTHYMSFKNALFILIFIFKNKGAQHLLLLICIQNKYIHLDFENVTVYSLSTINESLNRNYIKFLEEIALTKSLKPTIEK